MLGESAFWDPSSNSFSILSMTPSSSALSNRDMGEKSEKWCSFRRAHERKKGFAWVCNSRFAWRAAISLSVAPGRDCVNSRTLAKRSPQASRPQSLHIHDDEKVDVIHVSGRQRIHHKTARTDFETITHRKTRNRHCRVVFVLSPVYGGVLVPPSTLEEGHERL
jgi:hypothetical protein